MDQPMQKALDDLGRLERMKGHDSAEVVAAREILKKAMSADDWQAYLRKRGEGASKESEKLDRGAPSLKISRHSGIPLTNPGRPISDPKSGIPHTIPMRDYGLEPGGAIHLNMSTAYADAMGGHSGTILHPDPKGSQRAEAALQKLGVDRNADTGYSEGNMHLISEYGTHHDWGVDSANRRIYNPDGTLHSTYAPGGEEKAFALARADNKIKEA